MSCCYDDSSSDRGCDLQSLRLDSKQSEVCEVEVIIGLDSIRKCKAFGFEDAAQAEHAECDNQWPPWGK